MVPIYSVVNISTDVIGTRAKLVRLPLELLLFQVFHGLTPSLALERLESTTLLV
ncbi:hypothetical protein BCR33DRAFT_711132 [Rhizoclosmatium globosum]|uniref:Uncharacterized protein n=1 Tax=Rhizoclosmatium globosum TaxID=329046 RepID=A0A1Y2D3A7_9FUNG|nr:hypothetical protein BCR33DRAFT_711132 [Rhizoclosmatium globosum]|eukprot:ORY53773.1 hypothetical protein BCR33DRAFT_711132 [Rhizoclosmatium globosum]